MTRRCRKAEPDIADQAQMSPIGSRPRSPYPTARDQRAQKAAATIIERYGIYRAPCRSVDAKTFSARPPGRYILFFFVVYFSFRHAVTSRRYADLPVPCVGRERQKNSADGFRKRSWRYWFTVHAPRARRASPLTHTHAHDTNATAAVRTGSQRRRRRERSR